MPSFGENSNKHRATCDPALRSVLDEAIKHYDFSVIWGHRGKEDQNAVFASGDSMLPWPKSEHNTLPSRAFDVIPYPDGFRASDQEFYKLATYIFRAATTCGVRIKWGGHWRSFPDLAHYQLEND